MAVVGPSRCRVALRFFRATTQAIQTMIAPWMFPAKVLDGLTDATIEYVAELGTLREWARREDRYASSGRPSVVVLLCSDDCGHPVARLA